MQVSIAEGAADRGEGPDLFVDRYISSVNNRENFLRAVFVSTVVQLLAALVFLALYGKEGFYEPDTMSYINPAMELWKTGEFSVNGVPQINRTPGYPLFLAPFLLLRHWELAVIAAQCLIGGIVAGVALNLAARLWNQRAGIAAAVLFTISPLTWYYSSMILTERLSSFFIALVCAAMFRFMERERIRDALLVGVFSVCAIFTRPAALYMPYGIAVFFLGWGFLTKAGWKKTAACTLLFLLCSLAPVKAWELRNERQTGFKGFSAVSAINLYFYNAAAVLAKQEGVPLHVMQEKMGYLRMDRYLEQHPELQDLPIGIAYAKMEQDGKRIIKNNLSLYSAIHLRGMAFTIMTPGSTCYILKEWGKELPGFRKRKEGRTLVGFIAALIRETPVVFFTLAISAVLLFFWHTLSFLGIALILPRYPGQMLFLLGMMVYFILISGGPAGYARFRDPIALLFAVFAGIGIQYLRTRVRRAIRT